MKRATKLNGAALAGTVRLGDLTVNRLGFGAMHLCGGLVWGRPRDRGHANRVLHRAIERTAGLTHRSKLQCSAAAGAV
jgi:hypothetical protein